MLDKNKTYRIFTKPCRGGNQSPVKRFSKVRILYEDDISFYVASLTRTDAKGYPIHYSVKKHVFQLIELGADMLLECCKTCPLYRAAIECGQ